MDRRTNLSRSSGGRVPFSLLALLACGCAAGSEAPELVEAVSDAVTEDAVPEEIDAAGAVPTLANVPRWSPAFGYAAGWRVDRNIRTLADVNGDGRMDIVAFGDAGVQVATSTGSSFRQPELWVAAYGVQTGWSMYKHVRLLGDVTGDGLPDIVGFGEDGVYVSPSTGGSFAPPARWLPNYGYSAGWRVDRHIRTLSDVNGDGMLDVVGFGDAGVDVSISTGAGFRAPERWRNSFGYIAGSWRLPQNPRVLADVNGDGLPDIVGFGDPGVFVSLSTGASFGPAELWIEDYTYPTGKWRPDHHVRAVADVNGDGLADIVAFGDGGVYVSTSTGERFVQRSRWIADFGYVAGGWRVGQNPRFVLDMNDDGLADIVGFADAGPQVSYSTGTAFTGLYQLADNFGFLAGGWRFDRHPRMLGDVTGDRIPDIVGFGDDGVYVKVN